MRDMPKEHVHPRGYKQVEAMPSGDFAALWSSEKSANGGGLLAVKNLREDTYVLLHLSRPCESPA